jgi:hypothetical protein
MATTLGGLVFFQKKDTLDEWLDWRFWPHAAFSWDQGSDNVCASNAVKYMDVLKLNASVFWDFDHGCRKDCLAMWRAVDLMDFVLLTLMVLNIAHGPDNSGMRDEQCRGIMEDFFSTHTPYSSEHFKVHFPKICEESYKDVVSHEGQTREESVWEWLRNFSVFNKVKK